MASTDPPADLQALGAKIKRRRQALGIKTQQRLADLLDVNRSTVADWERGASYPGRHIGALEAVLGNLADPASEPHPDMSEELQNQLEAALETVRKLRQRRQGSGGAEAGGMIRWMTPSAAVT